MEGTTSEALGGDFGEREASVDRRSGLNFEEAKVASEKLKNA